MIINTKDKYINVKDMEIVFLPIKSAIDGKELGMGEYVQFTVIGHNSEWINWMMLTDFKELNPMVDLK